ncbi:MoxR family ATPase [Candidatus Micrarchaeota archaeon]|nr:MoxR family ATPase [Candidatus Micrarchaeota archaeon]
MVDEALVARAYYSLLNKARVEAGKVVVGQQDVIDKLLVALLANGHVLVEGVPGIAKTLMVRTLARISGCDFKRIQFTPDLLPSDVLGVSMFSPDRGAYTVKGPIFGNFVLADEINRASPKVQTALLEAMQERQVTIAGETMPLPKPFLVMATQNPLEQLGTYPLPYAELDRFLFKILVNYTGVEDEQKILHKNVSLAGFEEFGVEPVLSAEKILSMQEIVSQVRTPPAVMAYITSIVDITRKPKGSGLKFSTYVDYGVSTRATLALYRASKAKAFIEAKTEVGVEHVRAVAHDVLRHRLNLNYQGQVEKIDIRQVIGDVISKAESRAG